MEHKAGVAPALPAYRGAATIRGIAAIARLESTRHLQAVTTSGTHSTNAFPPGESGAQAFRPGTAGNGCAARTQTKPGQ